MANTGCGVYPTEQEFADVINLLEAEPSSSPG